MVERDPETEPWTPTEEERRLIEEGLAELEAGRSVTADEVRELADRKTSEWLKTAKRA